MPFVVNNELDDVMYQNALKLVDTDKIKVDLKALAPAVPPTLATCPTSCPSSTLMWAVPEGIFHS